MEENNMKAPDNAQTLDDIAHWPKIGSLDSACHLELLGDDRVIRVIETLLAQRDELLAALKLAKAQLERFDSLYSDGDLDFIDTAIAKMEGGK